MFFTIALHRKLDYIIHILARMEHKMAEDFTALDAGLTALSDEVGAAVAELKDLLAQLAAAIAASGGASNQPTIDALVARAQATTDALTKAVDDAKAAAPPVVTP